MCHTEKALGYFLDTYEELDVTEWRKENVFLMEKLAVGECREVAREERIF